MKTSMSPNKVNAKKVLLRDEAIDAAGYEIIPGHLVVAKKVAGKRNVLISAVAEKLPRETLTKVCQHARSSGLVMRGVYVTHDSMGTPRYIGRGNIESRLRSRFVAQPQELRFFSFYLVGDRCHEREVETLLIHVVGSLLEFNAKKRRIGLVSHALRDFEAGTRFYELQ